ncbi:hepatocyte growth factor receptor-like [Tropilaelaps mercedesae]|uniref:Hepatocyte growth factor receptor-like n=1 Tax=Tropilaelaps mercedesae TaxID=418985 RepID=A0A1V9XCB4_9ACAR|nr:hepatocyte growth factor receptor-like [Tropilaelaps mercedesae]
MEILQKDLDDALNSNKSLAFTNYRGKAHHLEIKNNLQPFTIKYLHAFEYNSFAFVVTVQPVVSNNVKKSLRSPVFETRVGRLCLDDDSMRSYTELTISCKTAKNVFDVAVHAKHTTHMSRQKLLVTMGRAREHESQVDPEMPSALCVFDVEELSNEFSRVARQCADGVSTDLARQSVYYQNANVEAPLSCQKSNVEYSECAMVENRFIIGCQLVYGRCSTLNIISVREVMNY